MIYLNLILYFILFSIIMSETSSETENSISLENYKEQFIITEISDRNYYKCLKCDFYTLHKFSIKRHLEKVTCFKEEIKCDLCSKIFKTKQQKENHLNRKTKCYIKNTPSMIFHKQNDITVKNDENEKLTIKLKEANQKIVSLEENIILKDRNLNDYKIHIFDLYSNGFVDKFERLGKYPKEINEWYQFNVEYHILFDSLFKYKIEFNEKNIDKIKAKVFLFLDLINNDRLKNIIPEFINNHQEYIPFIIEYRNNLDIKLKNSVDKKDTKINGKFISVFIMNLDTIIKK